MNGFRRIPIVPLEGREAPMLLLAALRDIDSTCELIYFGDNQWRLGGVRKTDVRSRAGDVMLEHESHRDHPNMRNVLLGHLLIEGFAQIAQYTPNDGATIDTGPYTDGDGNYVGSIVEDLRERDFHYRRDQGEAKFAERLEVTDGTARKREDDKVFKDYIVNDGRDHYRREVRNRTMFSSSGMTGGSGRIILP